MGLFAYNGSVFLAVEDKGFSFLASTKRAEGWLVRYPNFNNDAPNLEASAIWSVLLPKEFI